LRDERGEEKGERPRKGGIEKYKNAISSHNYVGLRGGK